VTRCRAWAQLALQLRFEPLVDGRRQPHRHDRRLRDVGGEEITFDERGAIGDLAFARDLPRNLDQRVIDFDPHGARPVLLRGEDDDAAVTGSQIVDDVVFGDAREPEHRVGERLRSHGEMDVGRFLRWRLRGNPENGQCEQCGQ
jgi:hypothetical protein